MVHGRCSGIVVETEAYTAENDEAAHTFSRPSARDFITNHDAGSAYVYLNYGMYWLANVLVKGNHGHGFVLIRAIRPERGIVTMQKRRANKDVKNLCSGPGKLTIALNINGKHHGQSFTKKNSKLWFEDTDEKIKVTSDRRIGISRSKELLWRFLHQDSNYVSKKKAGDISPAFQNYDAEKLFSTINVTSWRYWWSCLITGVPFLQAPKKVSLAQLMPTRLF